MTLPKSKQIGEYYCIAVVFDAEEGKIKAQYRCDKDNDQQWIDIDLLLDGNEKQKIEKILSDELKVK